MRNSQVLLSGIHFLLSIIVFLIGVSIVIVAYHPIEKEKWFLYLYENWKWIGFSLITLSILLIALLYPAYRSFYFHVEMNSPVDVHSQILQRVVEKYWKEVFPNKKLDVDVVIYRKKKIEFIVELPKLNRMEFKQMVRRIEKEVGQLLYQYLEYKEKFFFTFVHKN